MFCQCDTWKTSEGPWKSDAKVSRQVIKHRARKINHCSHSNLPIWLHMAHWKLALLSRPWRARHSRWTSSYINASARFKYRQSSLLIFQLQQPVEYKKKLFNKNNSSCFQGWLWDWYLYHQRSSNSNLSFQIKVLIACPIVMSLILMSPVTEAKVYSVTICDAREFRQTIASYCAFQRRDIHASKCSLI